MEDTNFNVSYESRTARDCYIWANHCLHTAEKNLSWEKNYFIATGIIFTAFSIEAMINHYGKIYCQEWDENKDSRKKLHTKLFKAASLPNYTGSATYKKANECFNERDKFAHGKTTSQKINIPVKDIEKNNIHLKISTLLSKPFQNADLDNLKEYIDVALKIQEDIERNGTHPKSKGALYQSPLNFSGIRTYPEP